jgi:Cu(I)/Ag(I) efflux system membrane fusion protein/cobalt-zinc-cadmium efflux system membrane fusion protein
MKRKYTGTIILLLIVAILSAGVTAFFTTRNNVPTTAVKTKKQMYHCPMHPGYVSDKAGPCPICGMTLVPIGDKGQSAGMQEEGGKRTVKYYRDAMKPWITSDKPGKASDGMNLIPVYEGDSGADASEIRIDPTTVQNMGVTTAPVIVKDLKKELRVSGTIVNDETEVYVVTTKIMGYVEKLHVGFTGQYVKKGEPLMSIYSPELVSTQEEYLQAQRYAKSLSGGSQVARDGAQELVESAKRRLQNWDISDAQIKDLEERGTPQKSMTIFSPANGVVLEKMVIAGQNIEAGMPLYRIADLSTVWAMANVYQEDLAYVKKGMNAQVTVPSIPDTTFCGNVQFVSPVLDMNSRTAQVRIAIKNTSDYQLKPQMFANVELLSPIAVNGLAIPQQAVIHSGKRDVVIIALGNGYFKPREVQLGAAADDYVQIISGLKEGETIVTSSQFLIDSESNLRSAVSKMSGHDSTGNGPQQDHKGHDMPGMKHDMPGMKMENMSEDTSAMQMGDMDTVKQSVREENRSNMGNGKSHSEKKVDVKVQYTCPMDKEVISDKPGKCPVCGMNLIKKE